MSFNWPEAFTAQMKALLGDEFDSFQAAIAEASPVSIRHNSQKNKRPMVLEEPVNWHPYAEYLKERPVFTLDPAFHAGAYYVQEASSMFIHEAVKQCVDLERPLRVLDLCAAPGGKSTLLADMLNNESILVVNEVIKSRVGVLRENMRKWSFPNVIVSNHDSEEFVELEGFFDLVLVDAPCSGEGLFRKDEEASGHWSPEAVQTCSARQKRILQAAAMLVAPGGKLLYSTCTYNTKENTENVEWFCRQQDFRAVSLEVGVFEGVQAAGKGYQFFPHKVKGEGFFLAVLEKTSHDADYVEGKIKLNRLPKKLLGELSKWIEEPTRFSFFLKPDNRVVAIPQSIEKEMGSVFRALFKRSSGLEIGEFKKEQFIPSHDLALSTIVSKAVPQLPLDKDNALLYLKRESFALEVEIQGWHLVCYQEMGLGWVKGLGNRVNNYLPKEWRIRMDIN
ncbi:RsmB/NOP family class I SAM-dependent RNA methyltransferase [Marinilongibacter aquaticus]|uniref:methyltransferase RsmF C-terminal domain-like protein n=1 Tax=Marinilongibacter aquaticus TaxID=2975157 RepID=UPI0021BD6333|nr:RsmB/NOP family class I SAM-dependent RNA methyltransferase [Marinilongibacter aquaticus]UBM60634.1 RsmB/NOP family class I SAM-dependent RNA methyltransferase [Marinilongibacter aquaticus]